MTPAGLVRRNIRVTTAGAFSDEPLRCALDALGEDSVMYSVDYPFESITEASEWLDAANLDPRVCAKAERENALAVLKLHLVDCSRAGSDTALGTARGLEAPAKGEISRMGLASGANRTGSARPGPASLWLDRACRACQTGTA